MMHILYVEDDPRLRRHVLHALMTHDHDVVEACNGAEACWLLNYHGRDLDLVITDIELGSELDGWMVAEHARQLSKDVGVIYATGTRMDHEPVEGGIALFKPFSAQALEQAIAEAAARAALHH